MKLVKLLAIPNAAVKAWSRGLKLNRDKRRYQHDFYWRTVVPGLYPYCSRYDFNEEFFAPSAGAQESSGKEDNTPS